MLSEWQSLLLSPFASSRGGFNGGDGARMARENAATGMLMYEYMLSGMPRILSFLRGEIGSR